MRRRCDDDFYPVMMTMDSISNDTWARWAVALILTAAGCSDQAGGPAQDELTHEVESLQPGSEPDDGVGEGATNEPAAMAPSVPPKNPPLELPAEPGSEPAAPLYAMMVQVIEPDGEDRSVYAVLSDTLDISEVSLGGAREFRGVANFVALDGRLLVSAGEEPRIDSFQITPELAWEQGPSVSFSNYPLAADGANLFSQWFVDDQTAYLPFEVSKRILWNPSDMTITGVRESSNLELTRGALTLENGGNRAGLRYPGAVMQAYFYHDEDWFEFAPTSPIAVYDPVSHEEGRIIEAPCPGLAVATRDEAGNTYFSTWDYSPGQALYGVAAAPCVAKIGPDLELDLAGTSDLTELTGGRYSINFRYVGGGKALAQVLHQEEIDLDFSAAYDPLVEDEIWGGTHWRPWLLDLQARTGAPLEGIEPESTGYQQITVDGRNFLFVTYTSGTIAYELEADGSVSERFRSPGEVFKWIRVR